MRQVNDLVAHRGDRARFPENTLPALQGAAEAGAAYVEFDVQLSSDRVPVLLHDATLARTGGGDQSVFDCTADELATRSVGEPDRFANRFADVAVATLQQAVELLNKTPTITAFVELKRHSMERFGIGETMDAVLPVMTQARFTWVLISFVAEAIGCFRQRASGAAGWVLRTYDTESAQRARSLAADYLFIKAENIPDGTQRLWQGPWRWVVYNVNSITDAERYRALGADLVETDRLGELLAGGGEKKTRTPTGI